MSSFKDEKNAYEMPPVVVDVPGAVAAEANALPSAAIGAKAASKDGDGVKPAEPKVSYFQLFRYATAWDKFLIAVGCVAAAGHGAGMPVMTIVFSNLIGSFVNFSGTQASIDDLNDGAKQACIFFVALAVGLFILAYIQMSFLMIAGENQAKRIREEYFKALLRQDIGWFDGVSTGELTTRMIADTSMIQEGISEKVGLIVQFLTTFVAGFVIAYVRGWRLALVLTACLPLLVASAVIMTKALAAGSKSGNTAYAAAGGLAQQVLSGIRTVVSFGGEQRSIQRYMGLLGHAEKTAIKNSVIGALGVGSIQLVIFSVYSLAFYFGARQIRIGTMDAKEVVNTFFSLIIGAFSLGQCAPSFTSIASGQGAAFKVFSTIDRLSPVDASDPGGKQPEKVEGNIVFKNVSFAYPRRPDVPILKNFNLTIKAGSTVALVGSSGSGKSTIIKLVERFYQPSEGSITLDGVELKDLNVTWLRQQTGLVSQEPTLFNCSVRQNILYGLRRPVSEYSKAEQNAIVEEACRTANADFVTSLPQSYDTSVGESGGMMSGGQKQRICIARMVARDPRIVLLDEATSALDTAAEGKVQAALEKASVGRTTIVIAHRLSTVKNADMIVVMEKGVVVETGSHDELIARGGVYHGLVEAQKLRGAMGRNNSSDSLDESEKTLGTPALGATAQVTDGHLPGDVPVAVDIVECPPPKPVRVDSIKADRRVSVASSVAKLTPEEIAEAERVEQLKRKVDVMRLVRMNKPEWGLMFLGVFCALGTGAVMPIFALIFAQILAVFGDPDPSEMTRKANQWALGFLILAIGAFIAQTLQIGLLRIAGDKLTTRLRIQSFTALVQQEIGYFDDDKNSTGALTARLAEDATLVQGLTGQTFAQIVSLISNFAVGLSIAFAKSWQLTLVVLACVPLVGVGGFMQLKSLTGAGEKAKSAYRDANSTANEALEQVRTVQTLTQEKAFLSQYSTLIEIPHKVVIQGAFVSAIGFAGAESAIFLTYAVAFWYGSRLILHGTYDPQQIMTALFAVIFSAMAAGQLTNFAPDASKAKLAALAIFDILDRNSRINSTDPSGMKPESPRGEPSADDVHFVYPTRPTLPILRGLQIAALPGQTVALVGHSGCGKSTVLGLSERWYDVTHGRMKMDGHDVREWNLRYLREQMALVGQEPVLFDISILENIKYGALEGKATQDQVEAAARAANIHDFIMSLPEGYATSVGERGGQMSGGQKQRIAIARALIRQPKLLLLDEATSALDSESEKLVQEALDKAATGRTTIVIAHRLSTIQNADRIYVVKAGQVAESGRHDELVAQGGLYAELVSQQMLQKEEEQ